MSPAKKLFFLIIITFTVLSIAGCSLSGSTNTKYATYTPKPPTPTPDLKVLFLGERLLFFWYWPQTHFQDFSTAADPSKYTGVGIHFEGGIYVNDVNFKRYLE